MRTLLRKRPAFETATLTGDAAVSESGSVSVIGSEIIITGGGTYVLSGELTDGSVIVDSDDSSEVRLVMNGVSVTSSDFSALYIKQSAKTVISLVGCISAGDINKNILSRLFLSEILTRCQNSDIIHIK